MISRQSPKFQTIFRGSKRESPGVSVHSKEWTKKTLQSGDANIWSLISSVRRYTPAWAGRFSSSASHWQLRVREVALQTHLSCRGHACSWALESCHKHTQVMSQRWASHVTKMGKSYHTQAYPACCSVLQCVAARYSAWQCVAVCCSVLQCVAVCCSVWTHIKNAVSNAHIPPPLPSQHPSSIASQRLTFKQAREL